MTDYLPPYAPRDTKMTRLFVEAGLYRAPRPCHIIVVGLGFGDESKGATVDFLCRTQEVGAVVRFSGGPQTLHHVVLPDGRVHGFSQFGSGTLSGVPTFHSRFSMINPFNMVREAEHLTKVFDIETPFDLVVFDERALIITPIHRALNRAREVMRGVSRHGSCGQGIGESQLHRITYPGHEITMRDLVECSVDELMTKLAQLYRDLYETAKGTPGLALEMYIQLNELADDNLFNVGTYVRGLAKQYALFVEECRPRVAHAEEFTNTLSKMGRTSTLVFEGTQGVLLDEWHGFHPHTTWSTTTFANAETLLTESGFTRDRWTRLGLTRAYTTRHGAGPLPGEDKELRDRLREEHNGTGVYQGEWRVSGLDMQLLEYSVDVCGGVDEIGVSHLDRVSVYGTPVVLWHDFYGERYPIKSPEQLEDLGVQEALTTRLRNLGKSDITVGNYDEDELVHSLEQCLHAPVTLRSYGPTWKDRVYTT